MDSEKEQWDRICNYIIPILKTVPEHVESIASLKKRLNLTDHFRVTMMGAMDARKDKPFIFETIDSGLRPSIKFSRVK